MSESRTEHRILIVNDADEPAYVSPKTQEVGRGDHVLFVVAGEKEKFMVCPETDVFQSIEPGEEIQAGLGSPAKATVRSGVDPHSVHRYEVYSESKASIDPFLVVHD